MHADLNGGDRILLSRGDRRSSLACWPGATPAAGHHEAARQILYELKRRAATEYVSALFRAWAMSEIIEAERARALLAEAFAERTSVRR